MSAARAKPLLLSFARKGEERVIREAIALLARETGGAEVAAVGTAVSAPMLRKLGISEVLLFAEGRPAGELVREIRRRSFEPAAIVYSDPSCAGHLKLEVLALASGARLLYRCLPGEPPRPLGRLALMGSTAGKALIAAASLAGAGAMCGLAYCWLRLAQMAVGGQHARRT